MLAPHQLTEFQSGITSVEDPVHLAGEHTSLEHGWIEGAPESAVRAALEVNGPQPEISRASRAAAS